MACVWVNNKYPHLGASPDGLTYDSKENIFGINEVKCHKALKDQTAMQWIYKGIPTSACVSHSTVGTRVLKRHHPYFYLVQLQLLVTGSIL